MQILDFKISELNFVFWYEGIFKKGGGGKVLLRYG